MEDQISNTVRHGMIVEPFVHTGITATEVSEPSVGEILGKGVFPTVHKIVSCVFRKEGLDSNSICLDS